MENKQTNDIEIKDNGIDKELLKKIVDKETLDAILDNKKNKRALANALIELAEQQEKELKALDNIYSIITTFSSPFLADYFYDLNQNVAKENKKAKNTTKKAKNNIQ